MKSTARSQGLSATKPRFGKQKVYRGLGKAGAKRLGQMLRKAIQQREGEQGNGNKPLPKTPVGLLKHQADVMTRIISSERRKLVPRVSDLILQVIAQCKSQGGISMVELKKALAAGGYDASKNKVNRAVKGLVRTETLMQTSGKGTPESYSFNTKITKLKDDKKMRTRAARKRDAGKAMDQSPQVEPGATEKASKGSTEALIKPAERDKQTRKAAPGRKATEPAKNAKTKAKASPRQARKSPKKGV
ncbi:hypothetical protein ACEWY4_019615 [Coilia grayii]|uniref:H15 domain-containing protein n=1 Tax=Coilia grayii TaxID=363190 RepID=A0ABD1JA67_9TELE